MTFQWITPPSVLSRNIQDYGKRALVAVQAAATYWGQAAQNAARQSAPWTDRTGNARGGLFFAVDGFGLAPVIGTATPEAMSLLSDVAVESGDAQTLIVTLGHTVYYGKFLELAHGGSYAIVMSTIEANLPQLERMLVELFR